MNLLKFRSEITLDLCISSSPLLTSDSQVQPGLTGVILVWWDKSWNLLACVLRRMQLMSWNNKIFLVTLTTKFTVNNKSYHCHVLGLQRYIICISVKYKYAVCNIVTLSRWGRARMVYPFLKKMSIFYSPGLREVDNA